MRRNAGNRIPDGWKGAALGAEVAGAAWFRGAVGDVEDVHLARHRFRFGRLRTRAAGRAATTGYSERDENRNECEDAMHIPHD